MLSRKPNFWLYNPDVAKGEVADPPMGVLLSGRSYSKITKSSPEPISNFASIKYRLTPQEIKIASLIRQKKRGDRKLRPPNQPEIFRSASIGFH
jgi:hypothetical protein